MQGSHAAHAELNKLIKVSEGSGWDMKKFLRNRNPTYSEVVAPCEADVKPAVQPPLPSYPPPPDTAHVVIKQERVDEEEEPTSPQPDYSDRLDAADAINTVETDADSAAATVATATTAVVATEARDQPKTNEKKIMCKQFARGECVRMYCKYAHEIIISQLDGVFTFCRNYQNSVGCSGKNCKFVHADVFEKARYLRTGILPAHARAHIKKPAPPPPPEDPCLRAVAPTYIPQTPMQPVPNGEAALGAGGAASCVSAALAREPTPWPAQGLKREWREDCISSPPCELDHGDHISKKCKNCEIMEFRLQFNKDKVSNMVQSTEEINKKMSALNKKNQKLTLVLKSLLKPSLSQIDRDQILELLNGTKGEDSITSHPVVTTDDSIKNMFSSDNQNIMTLMTQLLRSTGELQMPDTSRET